MPLILPGLRVVENIVEPGDTTPSRADIDMTRLVAKALSRESEGPP
jgi:hypothetical protein